MIDHELMVDLTRLKELDRQFTTPACWTIARHEPNFRESRPRPNYSRRNVLPRRQFVTS